MPSAKWTIVYRKRTGPVFHRIDLALTWHQAVDLARYVQGLGLGLEVWYVPNAETERDGRHPEDVGNVLTDSGKRVRIVEDGTLPFKTRTVTFDDAHGEPVTARFIREERNPDGRPNGIALVEISPRHRVHIGMRRLTS